MLTDAAVASHKLMYAIHFVGGHRQQVAGRCYKAAACLFAHDVLHAAMQSSTGLCSVSIGAK